MAVTLGGGFDDRETFFVTAYKQAIKRSAMQDVSFLGDSVMIDRFGGNATYTDIIDSNILPQRSIERFAVTEPNDFTYKRRAIFPQDWSSHQWYDRKDLLRSQNKLSPNGEMMAAVRSGFMQVQDMVISGAFGASVYDIAGAGETQSTVTFADDDGTTIAHTEAGLISYGTGLNVDKILRAATLLTENRVGAMETRYLACHPRQAEQLMNSKLTGGTLDTRVISRDTNLVQPLVEARVGYFCGFNFRVSPDVGNFTATGDYSVAGDEYDVGGGDTGRSAWAYTDRAIELYTDSLEVMVDIRADREHLRQVSHYTTLEAKRLHGERVINIECESTVAYT